MRTTMFDPGGVTDVRRLTSAMPPPLLERLSSFCAACGAPLAGGRVTVGPAVYCSVECAQAARDRATVPGNYLG